MTDLTWTNTRVALGKLQPWEHNPRKISKRAAKRLLDSWEDYGQVQMIVVGPDYEVYDGHQRINALRAVYGDGYEVEVRRASRALTEDERKRLVILLHTGTAGQWDWDILRTWDISLLKGSGLDEEILGSWQVEAKRLGQVLDVQFPARQGQKLQPLRKLPIDVIFTTSGSWLLCCIACKMGLMYGIQSPRKLCDHHKDEWHKVVFVDNHYRDYDHQTHVKYVASLRPKYATVRDMIPEDVCTAEGIAYYPPEQILDWAAEMRGHAENVIVIPKSADYIDIIPNDYVIGYSVPSAYGRSPFPISLLAGRRVHLLGGSLRAQLDCIAELGDSVISLDNNHITNIARFGAHYMPDGREVKLDDTLAYHSTAHLYPCVALSFVAVRHAISQLMGVQEDDQVEPAPEPLSR